MEYDMEDVKHLKGWIEEKVRHGYLDADSQSVKELLSIIDEHLSYADLIPPKPMMRLKKTRREAVENKVRLAMHFAAQEALAKRFVSECESVADKNPLIYGMLHPSDDDYCDG